MTAISIRCSCCGKLWEMPEDRAVCPCPACGTENARPASQGASLELLQRAIEQRVGRDFHNAERSYQQVLLYTPHEHEALWGRLLCHYGVEYVRDPATGKLMPTVHTVRPKPLQSHPDFRNACRFAPEEVRARYEAEAAYIDKAQADIRRLAETCPPFDVFLCHKTTEPGTGRRTEDYVRALQLYHYLTGLGVKVFFAPESLPATVAGAAYEAGIYHALHTAKLMLVFCSRPDYLTSAWVRSEWLRFLDQMDAGEDKRLLPLLYDGFSPADLPAEFLWHELQGLEMGLFDSKDRLTAIVRSVVGVKEAPKPEPKPVPALVPVAAAASTTDKLLERAHLYLEDGAWDKADEYAEKVLDQEPKNGRAYVVKVLARYKARTLDALKTQKDTSYEQDGNYQKAMRFGDKALKAQLQTVGEAIRARIEEERRAAAYAAAVKTMQKGDYSKAEQQFAALRDYRDAAEKAAECRRLEEKRNEELEHQEEVRLAKAYFGGVLSMGMGEYRKAEQEFRAASGYKDADEKAEECRRLEQERIAEEKRVDEEKRRAAAYDAAVLSMQRGEYANAERQFTALGEYGEAAQKAAECVRLQQEAERKAKAKRRLIVRLTALVVALVLLAVWGCNTWLLPTLRYNEAMDLLESGKYVQAYKILRNMTGFKDVDDLLQTDEHLMEVAATAAAWRAQFVVGNTVAYGSLNGEALQWRVLAVEGDRALLLAETPVAYKSYESTDVVWGDEGVTWASSSLRAWLNGDFMNATFRTGEREQILLTTVKAEDNTTHNVDAGQDTRDMLFLLSMSEVNRYLPTDAARICRDETGTAQTWWLRTPGNNVYVATHVETSGSVNVYGYNTNQKYAVRPAMWLNIADYVPGEAVDEPAGEEPVTVTLPKEMPSPGDVIPFGRYDGQLLQWRVLAVEGDRVLLLAELPVTKMPYHTEKVDITWEKCSLRTWLNGEFLQKAFSDAEREYIGLTYLQTEDNATTNAEGGNDTEDWLFLLSPSEVEKYMPVKEKRMFSDPEWSEYEWILRSPGYWSYTVAYVSRYGGDVRNNIASPDVNYNHAIRPAMWITMDP